MGTKSGKQSDFGIMLPNKLKGTRGTSLFLSIQLFGIILPAILFPLVDCGPTPQYLGSDHHNAHRHHHSSSTGRHFAPSSRHNQLHSSSSKEFNSSSISNSISAQQCEQVLHHFNRKGFKVTNNTKSDRHPSVVVSSHNNSSLVIAPTNGKCNELVEEYFCIFCQQTVCGSGT